MRIEDIIAANQHKARQSARLHQGVVVSADDALPTVSIAGQELEMVTLAPVADGDVVQILSAGDRWLVLGTMTPGSAPNLLPTTGWSTDLQGDSCEPPPTRFSISGDAARDTAVLGTGGQIMSLASDQGGILTRGSPLGPDFDAHFTQEANGHYAIYFGPASTYDSLDFTSDISLAIKNQATIVRFWIVANTHRITDARSELALKFFGWAYYIGTPNSTGAAVTLTASEPYDITSTSIDWSSPPVPPSLAYSEESSTEFPYSDHWGIHVYEAEFNLGTDSVRMWLDGAERVIYPATMPMTAGSSMGPCSIERNGDTGWGLLEWIVETGPMTDAERAAQHASLMAKYL